MTTRPTRSVCSSTRGRRMAETAPDLPTIQAAASVPEPTQPEVDAGSGRPIEHSHPTLEADHAGSQPGVAGDFNLGADPLAIPPPWPDDRTLDMFQPGEPA